MKLVIDIDNDVLKHLNDYCIIHDTDISTYLTDKVIEEMIDPYLNMQEIKKSQAAYDSFVNLLNLHIHRELARLSDKYLNHPADTQEQLVNRRMLEVIRHIYIDASNTRIKTMKLYNIFRAKKNVRYRQEKAT
ncbi:hypothetical protein ERX35_007760 [Macrococcus equipercicus]|uniref:Uncharacterized protein n=1 Tax=Macrococcus equipercicus TaxID=69967 RepID=A0ABQ6R7N1_9STAP|nr:hypothetical protein [Macrococcus equipercicus]KAA1039102.1 hypothetical protein ERX35_007760 [Macrococcus equipercicus]